VNSPKYYSLKPIDFSDKQFELIPEAYLDEGVNQLEDLTNEIDKISRKLISHSIISNQLKNPFIEFVNTLNTKKLSSKKINFEIFGMNDVFSYINTGDYHVSGGLDKGKVPLISCKTIDNGTEGHFDLEEGIYENCITIASDGSWPMSSFYHPYKFAAKDNVIVCVPKKDFEDLDIILFITAQLNSQIWRFSKSKFHYQPKMEKLIFKK